MFNALTPLCFVAMLSARPGLSASANVSVSAIVDSSIRYSSEKGLDVTKVFTGGQYIVHIAKPNGQTRGFMDVNAEDLLASYTFDSHGNMKDRAVWAEPCRDMSPFVKSEIASMVRGVLTNGKLEPWLASNLQVSVKRYPRGWGLEVRKLSCFDLNRQML